MHGVQQLVPGLMGADLCVARGGTWDVWIMDAWMYVQSDCVRPVRAGLFESELGFGL